MRAKVSLFVSSLSLLLLLGCSEDEPIGGTPPVDPQDGKALLEPLSIPKFVEPLVIPPAMPFEERVDGVTRYHIKARQFEQQVLPSSLPKTTVFGYGSATDSSTFNYPAFTVAARTGEPVRVTWTNDLIDEAGDYLPHLLRVDPTLHWANPGGPIDDMSMAPVPYTGPVPIVTHLHGGHVADVSDGGPRSWYLPPARNIPAGFTTRGTDYASVEPVGEGAAVFEYPNDQPATTLWYHDHAMGITRLNVYAGLAGFWLIGDEIEDGLGLPGPAPAIDDAPGVVYRDIPLAIQDRSFREDGSWFYPESRADFDEYAGPYAPDTEVAPFWNPEFFGNTIVVNGRTWPYHEVEPGTYRLRLVNGCNSRFLLLKGDRPELVFHQIGTEGGLLSGAPVEREEILLGPAERADVIVDFSAFSPGDEITLLNLGPDEPFKGVRSEEELAPADPASTGLVMRFIVTEPSPGAGATGGVPPTLPEIAPLASTLPPRDLTLNERMNHDADIPTAAHLGTVKDGAREFWQAVTEKPALGSTEVWRIANLTADAHPIHLHLVMFQVLDRIPLDAEAFAVAQERYLAEGGTEPSLDDFLAGSPIPAEPWENGWKDTVVANPGEITRIVATFDLAGRYVWHCHILEHEDNEMMRPFEVIAP